ncbi:MAG: hypothetical protein RBS39_02575 [Phycisphaerales bacterium]|jgi:hypothetical protein|nr:hypothetical protein [Phycisphaerales bacterium]
MGPKIRTSARRGVMLLSLASLALLTTACAGPVPARYLGEAPPADGASVVERNDWSLVMHGPSSAGFMDRNADPAWSARRDEGLNVRDGCDPLAASAWPAPRRPHLSDERFRSYRSSQGYTYYDRRGVTDGYSSRSRGSYRRYR